MSLAYANLLSPAFRNVNIWNNGGNIKAKLALATEPISDMNSDRLGTTAANIAAK